MKKVTLIFVISVAVNLNIISAQNSWVQKSDVGGQGRALAVAFSIGEKGYVGTGLTTNGEYLQDFWEFDPITDIWTQKTDFEGGLRYNADGFSIGSKGYIGTGLDTTNTAGGRNRDFWEYDPLTNTWKKRARVSDSPRFGGVGFSIGDKGYIGTGFDGQSDFWQYNPGENSWTQNADFAGITRSGAASFSIGTKGYVGTGFATGQGPVKDFWEYDPATNNWSQKANFGGTARYDAVGFSIGNRGYIGTGSGNKDLWEYKPETDTWIKKADFPGGPRTGAIAFSIGSFVYFGTGANGTYRQDFWQYIPDSICSAPGNLKTKKITSTSAQLKWDSIAGAQKYKLRYKVTNTNDWTIFNPVGHKKNIAGFVPSTSYVWQVRTYCQVDSPSILSVWSSLQEFTTLPYRLSSDEASSSPSFQLYPNPAEDHATIQFTLPQSSHITIKVFDASGKEIAVLLNDDLDEGEHSLPINTLHFPKQVYLVQLISDFGIGNQKLIVQ